jgi:hypothetical protein
MLIMSSAAPKMRQRLLLKAGIFGQARTLRITGFLFDANEALPDVRVIEWPRRGPTMLDCKV